MTFLKMNSMMNQFEIYIANLDPTIGSEIKKTRPVVIISPNELNHHLRTVIVAPITSKVHNNIPTRIKIKLDNQINYVVLDQLRTLDKVRLTKKIATLTEDEFTEIKNSLLEMFL